MYKCQDFAENGPKTQDTQRQAGYRTKKLNFNATEEKKPKRENPKQKPGNKAGHQMRVTHKQKTKLRRLIAGWKQTNQQRVRGKTGLNTQGVMNKWATGEQEKWCWRTDSEVESKTRQARMNFQHETGINKMNDDEDDEDKSGWGTHT